MKVMFHDDWTNRRLIKIKSILGVDWFRNKKVLELGACHGNIGIDLLKIGAKVHFCDARDSNLSEIVKKLQPLSYMPKVTTLNQENEYHLGSYDLVIHMGVLYHIKNWKQDLRCALNHAPLMFLETSVLPDPTVKEIDISAINHEYGPFTKENLTMFSAPALEQELKLLGVKFIRFYDRELNSSGWSNHDVMVHNLYDWSYDNIKKSTDKNIYNYRVFYLILS